ncbi:acyl-CoA thioesterase II [Mycolicibacterium murale]|jgi:acyl-CoA thioesterase II|uniref:Acyl-CoA thioesterase II n=1 Tax=Mycolicibacterium murale TaxID=182220 RepID=A0A7I9WFJ5_9MYCO|nr:acyl-CoA thioesterase domain-containing protein [Mycolicibacterium murale]MCV7182211.1 thioesterase family protein [Mycolicibacterium murale]GFG56036.1 acyl-CoA thioesterase II [Mycolicibacterium murale]
MSWIGDLLSFDRDGDVFVVTDPAGGRGERLFGGMIAAQALGAAGATVEPDKLPQSLHAYFVRGGRHAVALQFHVERTRDGRSFDTRRVTAVQEGQVILEMIASFHRPETGADWHPAPAASLELDAAQPKQPNLSITKHLEIRTAPSDPSAFAVPPYWVRFRDHVEDDPLLRACALTFVTDLGPVPAARPEGTPLRPDVGFAASLDHSVWFHRPFDPAAWHRYEVRRVNNNDSRGLVMGSMYRHDDQLIASMTQEALWRV